MDTLLHVDASILGDHSASRKLSAAVAERLKAADPGLKTVYRDLAATPLPHLSGAHLAAAQGATPSSPTVQQELAESAQVLEEFLAAGTVVIGAPMYNFTLPTQLKAWIDRILVAGKTFRYGANGVEGLARGKRVIVAVSRGGFYGPGTPAEAMEHLESYLKSVFAFIGITDAEFIVAEGLQTGAEHREKAMDGALKAAVALQAA
jgi:FMN-dependent NADH-azoreductase